MPSNIDEPELFEDDYLVTRKGAKKIIPVSDPTYWRYEKQGVLKPVRIGRKTFYRRSDLRELVKNGAP